MSGYIEPKTEPDYVYLGSQDNDSDDYQVVFTSRDLLTVITALYMTSGQFELGGEEDLIARRLINELSDIISRAPNAEETS